ncbi:hypothetical protein SDRG_13851 [Saprolegnia diclina VS20]|uniref:Ribosome assembly protein 3 n=1 Tax=Saprolegnia diclina (strain VS20) TaxID=1156394 RepID=T0PSQ4_SAPDV|nr:hypothetical protein SDRG_13851 [Saprolegnia diclina VS20]EQC28524.1 hypothetical protein SDRG_13851 [Saprolegnia diclina VS20]|eukprot:XP_008618172.1 hypothetical protein SDRG_13851 [Saprolegnia diclina VS20]
MTGYAKLIAALGEKPLEKTSALEVVDEDMDTHEFDAAEAADKTMRCADLLSQALEAAHTLQSNDGEAPTYDAIIKDLLAMDGSVKELTKMSSSMAHGLKASRSLLGGAEVALELSDEATEARFDELYMEGFASAFGDEIDKFRQDDAFEAKDVSYLITCIKAGGDVFSPIEKSLFVTSRDSKQ